MAKEKTSRKQLFKAALALAGMTAAQWADAEGITASYLSAVLAGRMTSQRLTDKIDAFIERMLSKANALVA